MKNLFHVSAFTTLSQGGNKAGVYINADNLSITEMQSIAKGLGYSETAFVMKSDVADFKVRFFTPLSEVDLCGHATIACFHVLKESNLIKNGSYTQETKAGILKLRVLDHDIYMQQIKPIYESFYETASLYQCFDDLIINPDLKPMIVSTGLREIFVPVINNDNLNKVEAKIDDIIELSKKVNVIGIHLFALDHDADAYGRNFAPLVGINEESATGTSNGALACYLYQYYKKKTTFKLKQGYSMNQPSEINVILEIQHDDIQSLWVGGQASILSIE